MMSTAEVLAELSPTAAGDIDLEFPMRLGILHRKRVINQLEYLCRRQNVTFDWCQQRGNSFLMSMSGRERDVRPIIQSMHNMLHKRR